ncbi:hypothetical protein Bca52824_013365 [Brassica carinata]|uniref:NOT2/NOT3/NOT5 C-terminal domain-containing protein n=1 Tax=Brassica carinata TaxID=52824 RepID=A0A8X8B3C5_BRACI|nr:hypothetical protein Bca52824_013365 [Brassica carinata]
MSSSSNCTRRFRRTFTPFFPQFGSMSPVLNPDGEPLFIPTSKATRGGPRNSGLTGVPYARFCNSSRAPPPPSSMGNTAGGGSMSRALISDGGSILSSTGSMGGGDSMSRALISDGGSILSSTGSMGGGGSMSRALISDGGRSPQVYSMPGSAYPTAAGGHSQTYVQAMNSLSSMSLMNSIYTTRTLKGVYDVEDHSFIPTSKATRGGPRNSGLTGVPYARFCNSILSSTGSMGGGGSMSRGLISDGGSILSSTGSMGGGLMSRALFSDGGSIMSSMGSMDGSTEHNRSMMIGLQGLFYAWKRLPYCCWGHSQTYVQAMNSLSSMSLMNSIYTTRTLKGVYDVEDHSFIPTSKATRGGPRNSGLTGVPYARFCNSSRAPPPPSSMGNTAGGGSMSRALISDGGSILSSTGSMGGGDSMSRALISDGGSILSSTGSMGGGGSMSRALISDGGSILSSTGSMGGGGSMSRGLISDGGSILSSTGSMGGGGLMSRALFSDGGSIMSSMGSMDGSTEHNRSMMIGLQGSPQVYSMPGSAYPTAAGGHSQTYVQAMNSLSSMSLMNSIYTTTDYQMDLHQQELMMQSQQSSMGRHGGFYFGDASMPTYPLQLPSAQAVSRSGVISSQTGGPPTIGSRSVNAATGYDQPLQHHQNTSQFGGQKLPAIGQPIRDTNPDVTTLALGIDLQAMGLDMTSKENLFKTFASPWANEPLKEDQDHFDLPQCYNAIQLPPPNQEMFRRFAMKTLFYIFYSMPKDEAQLYAANELNNRYWFYHKEHKCWFKRIGKPLLQTNAYERGTYDCFDLDKFETVQKENIVIYYEMLERRPSLPQHRV